MAKNFDRKKLRYSILMELNKGNNDINHSTYELSPFVFSDFIKDMQEDGLIRNAKITKDGVLLQLCSITMNGEDYLSNNSAWAKAYSGIKELRDWIPFY